MVRVLVGCLVLVALAAPWAFSKPPSLPRPGAPVDGDAGRLAALREQIKGKEDQPAEVVFKNIQLLKGVPAARMLSIMDVAYKTSLDVSCTYCHDPESWASDEKNEKRVTRQMILMMREINEKYLKPMKGLKSDTPVVNCTTCHRGQEKPALSLEPERAAGH